MKKLLGFPLLYICFATLIIACSEPKKKDVAYNEYKSYVEDVTDSMDAAMDSEWDKIESKYEEKKSMAEAEMNEWSDEMRQEYAQLEMDWVNFKDEMEAEKMRREQRMNMEESSKMMLPEGINSDMSNVTAANILAVHTAFVDYVSNHKDELSREQWDQAEMLWERLGTRKNEIEKEISSGDNIKIAEQKVRFGAIKAVNRPVAKAEENAAAKE